MSLTFFQKRINEISFADVKILVEDKYPESYDLEYKLEYISNEKLAKLMISFANASGGYIIIGVRTKKINDNNTGIPDAIDGINKEDHSTKITQIALAYSQPKIIPQIRVIEHEKLPDKDVVIIKINEALEPIMYYHANDKDSNKFFIRINDKIEPADQPLLKKLFSRRPFYDELENLEYELSSKQEEIIEDYALNAPDQYILFGINIIPLNNNLDVIDINNYETEVFIENLHNSLLYKNPDGRMVDIDQFLRHFNYMGDHFVSNVTIQGVHTQNISEVKIYKNGNILANISYKTQSGLEIAKRTSVDYDGTEENKLKSSAYLFHKIIPYIIIIWLKFSRLFYDQKFFGRFKFKLRILSTANLGIKIFDYLKLSYTDDINVEEIIYALDLKDSNRIWEILKRILIEILRYFDFNLQEAEKKFSIFEDIIKQFMDVVFK